MLHEVPLLKSYPTSLNRNQHNSQITQIIELNNFLSEDVEYHILKTSNLSIKRFEIYRHLKKVFHIFFVEAMGFPCHFWSETESRGCSCHIWGKTEAG